VSGGRCDPQPLRAGPATFVAATSRSKRMIHFERDEKPRAGARGFNVSAI